MRCGWLWEFRPIKWRDGWVRGRGRREGQVVFDMQLGSVTGYVVPAAAPARLEVHPVTQRYAQLTASLLLLNADYQVGAEPCPAASAPWHLPRCQGV